MLFANELKKPYIVLRKTYKPYMGDALHAETLSITTGKSQLLVLDEKDRDVLAGKSVVLLDDVISTGSTLQGMRMLMQSAACHCRQGSRYPHRGRTLAVGADRLGRPLAPFSRLKLPWGPSGLEPPAPGGRRGLGPADQLPPPCACHRLDGALSLHRSTTIVLGFQQYQSDGMKNNIRIYAEQTGAKGSLPEPAKYVDRSYLLEALKELDKK